MSSSKKNKKHKLGHMTHALYYKLYNCFVTTAAEEQTEIYLALKILTSKVNIHFHSMERSRWTFCYKYLLVCFKQEINSCRFGQYEGEQMITKCSFLVWTIPLLMLGRCKAYRCPGCLFFSLCVVLCICLSVTLSFSSCWVTLEPLFFSPQAQHTQLKELRCPDDKMHHNETM